MTFKQIVVAAMLAMPLVSGEAIAQAPPPNHPPIFGPPAKTEPVPTQRTIKDERFDKQPVSAESKNGQSMLESPIVVSVVLGLVLLGATLLTLNEVLQRRNNKDKKDR